MVHISLARVRFSKNRRKCTSEKPLASDVTWLYWNLKILKTIFIFFVVKYGRTVKKRSGARLKTESEIREASETPRRCFEPRENDLISFDIETDCFAVYICKVCTSLATLENCCIFVKWHNSLRTTSERASLYGVLRKGGFWFTVAQSLWICLKTN